MYLMSESIPSERSVSFSTKYLNLPALTREESSRLHRDTLDEASCRQSRARPRPWPARYRAGIASIPVLTHGVLIRDKSETSFQDHLESSHFKSFAAKSANWVVSKNVPVFSRLKSARDRRPLPSLNPCDDSYSSARRDKCLSAGTSIFAVRYLDIDREESIYPLCLGLSDPLTIKVLSPPENSS